MKSVFYDSDSGCELAAAEVPEGWQLTGHLNEKMYYGEMNPIGYYLQAVSADGNMVMDCLSPADYSDPPASMGLGENGATVEGKTLWYKFRPTERCTAERLQRLYPQAQSVTLVSRGTPQSPEALGEITERYRAELAERYAAVGLKPENIRCEDETDIYDIVLSPETCLRAAVRVVLRSHELKNAAGLPVRNWEIAHDTMFCTLRELFAANYPLFSAFDSSVKSSESFNARRLQAVKAADSLGAKKSAEKKGPSINMRVAADKDNRQYAGVKIPDDWTLTAQRSDIYSGYGFPFRFMITAKDPSGKNAMYYLSPYRYRDDFSLQTGAKPLTDDYGRLLRAFVTVEEFIDAAARYDLSKCDNSRLVRRLPPPYGENVDYDRLSREKFTAAQKEYGEKYPDRVLNSLYYRGAVSVYAYSNKGSARMRAYCVLIDAIEYTDYADSLLPDTLLNDPFMAQSIKGVYPGLHVDARGRKMFVYDHCRYWLVKNYTVLDAPEGEFEKLYKEVYTPFACCGAVWQRALNDEMDAEQNRIDKKNAATREDKARAQEIYNKMERDRIAADRERADIMHRANEEVSSINRAAYENRSRAQDRANQRWSDSFRGDTRYTDRYNDEYVVHGTGRYAYKRGNTVVSTDDPYGPGYDWEELKKKD